MTILFDSQETIAFASTKDLEKILILASTHWITHCAQNSGRQGAAAGILG